MISFTITKFIPANVVITANFFPFFVSQVNHTSSFAFVHLISNANDFLHNY